jgi:hypothetical protein
VSDSHVCEGRWSNMLLASRSVTPLKCSLRVIVLSLMVFLPHAVRPVLSSQHLLSTL